MARALVIDGAYGEGGGQILRTSLALAAITGRAVRIERIRAGRPKPGLAAQHLTAVRALAALSNAALEGDALGSRHLAFRPRAPVRAGDYRFDVALAREGGSAGAATLVVQAALLPLALAPGRSTLEVRGGTHVDTSPVHESLDRAWLPLLARMGVRAALELVAYGFFPVGGGCIRAEIEGTSRLAPLELVERGPLLAIEGRAIAANLPAHIPQRMTDRAGSLLRPLDVPVSITPMRVRAACPGAGIVLVAHYEQVSAAFVTLGRPGKASELVAEEAVQALLAHHESPAALERHLGDQMLLPMALAAGPSRFTVEAVSRHLTTTAWVIERFDLARVTIEPAAGESALLTVTPGA